LCDLDEQKFPNPNHLSQLLKTSNVENSVMDTINSSLGGNTNKNAMVSEDVGAQQDKNPNVD